MLTARVVVGADEAQVFAPFAVKDVCRTLPERRWDKAGKCWLIPTRYVDVAARALRDAGCEVFITRSDGSPWTSGRSGPGRTAPGAAWAEVLLDAVGPRWADAVFRALVRVLHPDAGGDPALMKDLNAARDRISRRTS